MFLPRQFFYIDLKNVIQRALCFPEPGEHSTYLQRSCSTPRKVSITPQNSQSRSKSCRSWSFLHGWPFDLLWNPLKSLKIVCEMFLPRQIFSIGRTNVIQRAMCFLEPGEHSTYLQRSCSTPRNFLSRNEVHSLARKVVVHGKFSMFEPLICIAIL